MDMDATFSALSDPTRRAILGLLANEELSVGELVDQFSITQSAVSRHLNVLEHANLIERRRVGQRRVCTLRTEPLAELDKWMEQYRAFWQDKLNRLDKVVAKRKKQ